MDTHRRQDGFSAERRRFEQERMELERIKIEIERKKIEFERKQIERKRLRQEKAQSGWLASIPKTTMNSIERRHRLAVFPVSEIGFPGSDLKDQIKYIDFIIEYTSDIPDITLTHSYYP